MGACTSRPDVAEERGLEGSREDKKPEQALPAEAVAQAEEPEAGPTLVDDAPALVASKSCVKVAVVVRPLLEQEKQRQGGQDLLEAISATQLRMVGRRGAADLGAFEFDRVYRMASPGRQLFAEMVQPLLQRFVAGFNATVFAYGQTGSGKTHVMGTGASFRQVREGAEAEGVIPRTLAALFAALEKNRAFYDVTLKVSYVEIHQDDIRDLLVDGPMEPGAQAAINVRESPARGTYLENVSETEVASEQEVGQLLEAGNVHRAVAAHNLNEASSRSHAVCTLLLEQGLRSGPQGVAAASPLGRPRGGPAPLGQQAAAGGRHKFLRSKLHLIDLAGSERVKDTGSTGQTFREGVEINKGLHALGNVIAALTEGQARQHIPYRNSKLTRILQDSLGGTAETLLLACVSPAAPSSEATLATLRFAARSRHIQNSLHLNNRYTQEDEIAYLRAQLDEKSRLVDSLQIQLDALQHHSAAAVSPSSFAAGKALHLQRSFNVSPKTHTLIASSATVRYSRHSESGLGY